MNQFLSIFKGSGKASSFLMTTMLSLLMLLSAEKASAYDFMWDGDKYVFRNIGTSVSIELPIYDKDGRDMWVIDGYVYVKAAGKTEQTLLHYKSQGDISGGATTNDAKFNTSIGGVLKIKDTSGSWVRLSESQQTVKIYSSGDHFTAVLEWEAPYEWRGMDLEFTVKVHGDQNSWKEWNRDWTKKISALTPPPDKIEPSIVNSMLAIESGHAKEVGVMWQIAASQVTRAVATFKANGVSKSTTLPNESFGTIYVPSDQLINDLQVEVDYMDSEKHKVTGQKSTKYDVAYFHQAKNVKTKLLTNGKVELTWEVDNPTRTDIQQTDYWIIQRNVKGIMKDDDDGWTTIGQISFKQDETGFKFTDETLTNVYEGKTVYYRVQRASVANSWGYGTLSGAGKGVLLQQLALPDVLLATAVRTENWGKNDQHMVKLSWDTHQNSADIATPTFSLCNVDDWNELCILVSKGFNSINVAMLNDIDISSSEFMLGESNSEYIGTFDGRGHTLTVNYNTTEQYSAPFRYVGEGAVIKNLHTAGTVKTSAKFAGGIVARVSGSVTIDKCWSSVEINSSVNGDGTHGGIVALAGPSSLSIENCLFDGKLLGGNTHSCGGIMGWRDNDNTTVMKNVLFNPQSVTMNTNDSGTFNRNISYISVQFTNCYYTQTFGSYSTLYKKISGTAQEQKSKLGNNWTVLDDKCVPLIVKDFFSIKSVEDWDAFVQIVNNGNTATNAVLEADVDISSSTSKVGTESNPYRGTFNGCGHTLKVGYNTDVRFTAPFMYVGAATFKNLHVTGSVKGGMHSAGLIGLGVGEGRITIANCRVSADITFTGSGNTAPHGGGFVGHGDNMYFRIQNSLFDGKLTATSRSDSYGGAFVGWEHSDKSSLENNLECGTYNNIAHAGFCYRYSGRVIPYGNGGTNNNTNNYSFQNWGEMGDGHANVKDIPASELAAKLGSGWTLEDGKCVPVTIANTDGEQLRTYVWDYNAHMKLYTDKYVNGVLRYTDERVITENEREAGQLEVELLSPCVDYGFRIEVLRGASQLCIGNKTADVTTSTYEIPVKYYPDATTPDKSTSTFYFDNNVKMDSLRATQLHDAVLLKWYTNGGAADYYEVYRRDLSDDKGFMLLNGDVMEKNYTDMTVKAHHEYEYKVKAVVQCEGVHIDSLTCKGQCDNFGRVSGFVRMPNGTGIGGVEVKATPDPSLSGVGVERIVTTDETGYFLLDSLFYLPNNGLYAIQVQVTGDGPEYTSASCNFSVDKNEFTNTVLALREYYVFTGKVLYDGTSIPVPGAQFRLDGKPLYNHQQKRVETDNQGAFTINIPAGPHKIQVEKEGHVFENEGYYIDQDNTNDPTEHNWQRNIADIYLWDQTRVTLRGRMVGGEIQASKPLGQSLSTNNLGRNLKMVMQLEGDNTSWIVRDPQNLSIMERDDSLRHGALDPATKKPKDITRWHMTRHIIEVYPDEKTGEYEIKLPPVKYKITEQSCTGYPTLFQEGKVGETLDLTHVGKDSIAEYKCVYHSPVKLAVTQFNISGDKHFGEEFYMAQDIDNHADTVKIWTAATDSTPECYVLKNPVFMSNASYLFNLQAQEEYPFENRVDTVADIVPLHEGTVYFHNDLVGNNVTDSVKLDSIGRGVYKFIPKNTTFLGNDKNALRTLDINLLYDGVYYDIKPFDGKPLKCYVMGAIENQGKQTIAKGGTHLIDILRDPPGSGSSAYIEKGSKLKYSYTAVLDGKVGISLDKVTGTGANYYVGTWAGSGGGPNSGTINTASSTNNWTFNFNIQAGGTWVYSYEMNTTERIQTSSSNKWIGNKADLFIGFTDNFIFSDGIAVRMVPESQYKKLINRTKGGGKTTVGDNTFDIKNGTVTVLAEGVGADGQKVYLISDEVLTYSTKFNSDFIHSTDYIETELIPYYVKLRNERLLPKGTSTTEAQKMADNDGRNVYISTVDASDPTFGFNASLTSDNKDRYTIIRPAKNKNLADDVADYNAQIVTWSSFLAKNEYEKVMAPYMSDLVRNYDFDGTANLQYSETFNTSDDYSCYFRIMPISFSKGFVADGVNDLVKTTFDMFEGRDEYGKPTGDVMVNGGGSKIQFKIKPVLNLDFNDKNGKSESWSKKTGFTLSAAARSNYNISVYRTKVDKNAIDDAVAKKDADVFLQYINNTLDHVRGGFTGAGKGMNWTTYASNDEQIYGNFIFRTNGGATCQPWEDERKTKYYSPGTVYDQKTLQIDQLRIWADQSIVSNVPYGEPARYTIHMVNESPFPEQATQIFNICAPDDLNQKGAKVFFGGNALNGSGYTVLLKPGEVITKEVEVYAGSEFDYEDIGINLLEPNDPKRPVTVKLSAHFVPSAGNIAISTPGDKWVMNTESPYDKKEYGYYMPVRIDGFNVNQRNFDHIELQYKLSTQGDKDWVNICSYYKSDSLMALASGTCKLIENDGYIIASFFGEKDPVEQYYDLRAVVYCRNGNGFLTASSPILTGVKDTRRPQLFGTPKPVNGVLGIGDDITISFSEPIAGNYLSEVNNFEVLGLTNSANITQGTCLRFNGGIGAETQSNRNLSARSFTLDVMIEPDEHTKAMGIFKHGTVRKNLQAGLTAENHLMVIINKEVFVSDEPVKFSGLHQVSYVFKADSEKQNTTISFYDGNTKIGSGVYEGLYEGVTPLVLGDQLYLETATGEALESEEYRGKMLEMRLWNKALSEGEIQQYAKKRLTGYESGLLDNFALNEGKGKNCYNKAVGGTDLLLRSATWSVPAGLSVKLDGEKGIVMNDSAFVRTDSQDYTLMFWFRTSQSDGTLLSNGPALEEPQWKNHFNIGLKEGKVYYRSGNFEVKNTGSQHYNDGAWHHMAVTLNRARNVGNLYIDNELMQSFAVDTLGGIYGGTLAAGVTYVDAYTTSNALAGNIDELALYEMTLPLNVIKDYASTTPTGREMGTLVYLPFSRSEVQKDHSQRMVASGQSLKQSRDNQGNYSTRLDVIIPDSELEAVSDRENYAPIDNTGQRENLNYSYVADKQNLLINIDEPAQNLEKTHVYITVRDVADVNGNLMENPVMMDLYVYRNPLRWSEKRLNIFTDYGFENRVEVTIQNQSGKTHSYYLDNLPLWITPSKTSGTIAATDEETITLTVSPYANIGDFDEVISLVTEEGLSEVLPIHIKVRGERPDWAISESLKKKNITMNMVARVKIDGIVTDDPDDIIGVFGNSHEPLGVARLSVDNTANANEPLAFITVYNNTTAQQPLRFEYYDNSTGHISVLQREDGEELVFLADTLLGSTSNPIMLVNSGEEVQMLQLKKGWNWLSFYMKPEKNTISNLLNRATQWEVGDALEVLGTNGFYEISYKGIQDSKNPSRINYFWDNGNDSIELDATKMYRFYSCNEKTAYLSGNGYYEYINVHQGWNRVAYISHLNLPIATALADYTANATVGDIIKSQSEFSMLVEDTQGNRMWKGTLTHLTAGQGYMIKHVGTNDVIFYYPSYEGASRYGNLKHHAPMYENNTGCSMNIVARTAGVDLQEGDCLVAFNGAEICGVAEKSDDNLFYLSVGDYGNDALSFAIQRGEELIALSGNMMTYMTDAVIGTVEEPTVINFAEVSDQVVGEWYDLQGRKLDQRPQVPGIYIFNGQKILIK